MPSAAILWTVAPLGSLYYNVVPGDINRHENRPRSQGNRLAMRLQGSAGRIDAKCRHAVLAGFAPHIVAPGDVKVPARRMRPCLLHILGKRHRGSLDEACGLDVYVVRRELGPNCGI